MKIEKSLSFNEIKEILLKEYTKYFEILDIDMQTRQLIYIPREEYKKKLDENLDHYMQCEKKIANIEALQDHEFIKKQYEKKLEIYNEIKKIY